MTQTTRSARSVDPCLSCRYAYMKHDGWCYMFKEEPRLNNLCGQFKGRDGGRSLRERLVRETVEGILAASEIERRGGKWSQPQ